MKIDFFNRDYLIITCNNDNIVIDCKGRLNNDSSFPGLIGKNIYTFIHKKEDTQKNSNFYMISDIKDKIFTLTPFGDLTGSIYIVKEIDSDENLYFKANYDMLTSLPNRNLLNDRFNLLLSQSKRSNNKLAILFIDLDGFKKVNDSFGHNAGDLLLVEISERLKKTIRDSDTIARWGGDEFIILLNNVDSKENINIFVNRMIEDCSRPVKIDRDIEVSVSLSIGISIYPDDGREKTELLESADESMYEAKNDNKIHYHYSS